MEMDAKLVEAARMGDVEVLGQPPFRNSNLLLQSTPLGNTALHIAVRFGQQQFCKELYQQCHSLVWTKNLKGETPLHVAARTGRYSVMESLVRDILSIDVESGELQAHDLQAHDILRMGDAENNTALHEAIRNRHLNVVKLLTEADPVHWCLTNDAGESPLYLATLHGFEDMVLQALQRRTPLSLSPHDRPRPLSVLNAAVIGGHIEIVKILVEERRELIREQDSDRRTALHYAASIGDVTAGQLLLKSDPSIAYILDNDGHSPLHEAAINGHIQIIKELLRHCPDIVDLSDNRGQNALHVAIKSRKLNVVQYLLSKDELVRLVNQRDDEGNTALHLATIHYLPIIMMELLSDSRVDLRAENKDNLTAFDIVDQQTGIIDKVAVLVSRFATNGRLPSQSITTIKHKPREAPKAKSSLPLKDAVNNLLVVATLIATVAFSAALTMPGGYRSEAPNQGTAALIRNASFKAFVIFDALAICFATCAVFLLLCASINADHEAFAGSVSTAIVFTLASLECITVAFVAVFSAVLSELRGLAIGVCIVICSVLFVISTFPSLVQPHQILQVQYFFLFRHILKKAFTIHQQM